MPDQRDMGGEGGLVPPALLARLEERIREDLHESPPTRDSQLLRREVAQLLPKAGAVGLYEYLGISVGATTGEVTQAFIELGRRIHPSLHGWLDLPEAVLRLLFEHAAHAYLVLSDPLRRKEYDREHSAPPEPELRSEQELAEVRREMARRAFRRAQSLMKSEQYHYVVELLREPVHWDPRPESLALLAEAQAKNPKWRVAALENLQHAVRLAPDDPAYRLKLGRLLEDMERTSDAIAEYRAVLEKVPNQPDATAGLERLGAQPAAKQRKGWLR
ncbi:MAG TPA: DnaJ domain-containing protein [Thermoanaerobaculia bacterium]|jgi:tetratricopeptide (TPR) repeat protein|nr:DnaJ domain-containing protein [Thermoanaerobaculia bacterium]